MVLDTTKPKAVRPSADCYAVPRAERANCIKSEPSYGPGLTIAPAEDDPEVTVCPMEALECQLI